jgi:hypothetical protein
LCTRRVREQMSPCSVMPLFARVASLAARSVESPAAVPAAPRRAGFALPEVAVEAGEIVSVWPHMPLAQSWPGQTRGDAEQSRQVL